ncbi:bifunctional folylpolyglutamate synthase/dihydrofolate synthase [candidate division KSB1 bacterium]|nr:bifunctional folylpolyglutamate synthase/dihydrofolate synthase [candidate division KSB1 bacterium]RQW05289.1 MAG: bifunctional folylpolyglutamate synthase/dihydrofolate synthase [candidate division KSB1 bacterium]
MTLEQALAFLESRIVFGWKLGLDSMRRMLAEVDDPHERTRFVHIAGTNGKGSVAAMLESIFRSAGHRTGLYTSPHLVDVRERIRSNGEQIGAADFCRLLHRIRPIIEKYDATYFETLTLLAFLYFDKVKADIVFLEVGLGGRLDATNVVIPELSIITTISFDHTEHLGGTLAKIAGEKAGIIKSGRPCLIGEMAADIVRVFRDRAARMDAPFYQLNALYQYAIEGQELGVTRFSIKGARTASYVLGLNGDFQVSNACLAIAACDILSAWRIDDDHIATGLECVSWPGRFQLIRGEPMIICDVAHNVASIGQLVRTLRQLCAGKKIVFIIGLLKDKDVGQITKMIAEIAHFVQPVEPDSIRAISAQELQSIFAQSVNSFPPLTVAEGLRNVLAQAREEWVVCVTGSHYVVGEALTAIKGLTK